MRQRAVEKIKQVFIDMLDKMPLDKITVTELCAQAQINRGTFYRYYQDVYAVLEDLEDSLLAEMADYLTPIYTTYMGVMSTEKLLQLYLEFLKAHKQLLKAIFAHTLYGNFSAKLTKQTALPAIKALSANIKPEYVSYSDSIAGYFIAGSMSLIIDWIKGELALSAEELAAFICQAADFGIKGFCEP